MSTLVLEACSSKETTQNNSVEPLQSGIWNMEFHHPDKDISIPVRTEVAQGSISFINGDERITTAIEFINADSFYFEMPVFGTFFNGTIHSKDSISGLWTNPFRTPLYQIPFAAQHQNNGNQEQLNSKGDTMIYDVRFSPNTNDTYPAVGIFVRSDDAITGTFLTETGDYRFLEGKQENDKTWLSCFDGSHLFYFEYNSLDHDSISGKFYSGKHWEEPFSGRLDPEVSLAHPDSITKLTTPADDWSFTVLNKEGKEVSFNPSSLEGQVTIVQILGSWCPNCMDETVFFNKLYASHKNKGLNIIPVAFEAGNDTLKWKQALDHYATSLDLPYDFYIGGSASKNRAGEIFSMLDKISSFPTTIFIDKSGKVRKIHTGFYGPGTGSYFNRYKSSTQIFIEQLLAEDHSTASDS